jgi:hypothetical protein
MAKRQCSPMLALLNEAGVTEPTLTDYLEASFADDEPNAELIDTLPAALRDEYRLLCGYEWKFERTKVASQVPR